MRRESSKPENGEILLRIDLIAYEDSVVMNEEEKRLDLVTHR